MVALTRKTGLPIGACRAAIELTALFFGWRLGGMVGIGTVLFALLIGFCVQIVFRLLKSIMRLPIPKQEKCWPMLIWPGRMACSPGIVSPWYFSWSLTPTL